jgi:lipoyl(octanoyl) transferase
VSLTIPFHHLPDRTGSGAENMALDFLLLKRYPEPGAVRFRHYDWRNPAFTFGYGQKIAFIRERLPEVEAELVRRPTGGGLVDHRSDWTYALVIPRSHPMCARPAGVSYQSIHDTIRKVLAAQGHPVTLKTASGETTNKRPSAPGVCFEEPETFDVIHSKTGVKVAGAAQKRTGSGLLFQGSLERSALPECDWDAFADLLATELAENLDSPLTPVGWPDFDPEEESHLTAQFASEEWLERR